jgi:hypothetical protein
LTLLDPNNPQPNSAYETVVNSLAHPHLEAGQQVVGGGDFKHATGGLCERSELCRLDRSGGSYERGLIAIAVLARRRKE